MDNLALFVRAGAAGKNLFLWLLMSLQPAQPRLYNDVSAAWRLDCQFRQFGNKYEPSPAQETTEESVRRIKHKITWRNLPSNKVLLGFRVFGSIFG